MQYIIGGLILIFLIKLALDLFANYRTMPGGPGSKSKVIDISDRWINIDSLPYKRKNEFLSGAEQAFGREIETLLENSGYRVLPKIPLAEIVAVPASTHNRAEYLQRARERTLDMVIFELPEFIPRLVIITEEGTLSKKRQLSDMFTEKALAAAGYAYMKINISEAPDPQKVLQSLQKLGISV